MNTSQATPPEGLRARLSRRAGSAALVALAFAAACTGLFAVGRSVGLPLPGNRILTLLLVWVLAGIIAPAMLLTGGDAEGLWPIFVNAAIWFAIVFAIYVLSRSKRGLLIALAVLYILLSSIAFILILPMLG